MTPVHWMDRLGAAITRRPRLYEPIFAGGWGDQTSIPTLDVDATVAVAGLTIEHSDTRRIDDLRFLSPLAGMLPAESRMAHARFVRPRGATRAVVLFAAFNDHGYATRSRLAYALEVAGVATLMLENPFYGTRRASTGQAMRTVSDLLAMGAASVAEGIALGHWLRDGGWTIGFSGYSMGGSMAALAGSLAPFPVALAPMAASYAPSAVYVDAALSGAVDWGALADGGRQRLRSVLEEASSVAGPPPLHGAAAVFLAASGDGYVPLSATRRIVDHWPGSELRIVAGGHASLLRRLRPQVQVIADAFSRFEAWQKAWQGV